MTPVVEGLFSVDIKPDELIISKNTVLKSLVVQNSPGLSKLDISGCMALEILGLSDHQLTELNVSQNPGLKSLYCYNGHLTVLNIKGCKEFKELHCESNQLTSLNMSEASCSKN